MKKVLIALVLFCLAGPLSLLSAQTPKGNLLSVTLDAFFVVQGTDEKGKPEETYAKLPQKIPPGGLILYEITALNTSGHGSSTDNLANVTLLGHIPDGTEYEENSVSHASWATFSIDTGNSFHPWPIKRMTRLEDATEVLRPVPASTYTDIRWMIPLLKPGQTVKVSYRVRVAGN